MARPTSDPKESKIVLRINNTNRERLDKEAKKLGVSLSQHIRDILSAEKNPASQNSDLSDIRQMATCFHVTTEELLKGVCEGLNDGSLTVDNGKVVGIPDIDMSDFYEVCHDLGLKPQEALNKMVQNMRRGK